MILAYALPPSLFQVHVPGPGGDGNVLGIVLTIVGIGYSIAFVIAAVLWWWKGI